MLVHSIYFSLSHVVAPMDYGAVSTFLMFDSCEMQSCTNITIVDDMVLELLESFSVTLERTPGLDDRITLDPIDGVVEINDNDGMLE